MDSGIPLDALAGISSRGYGVQYTVDNVEPVVTRRRVKSRKQVGVSFNPNDLLSDDDAGEEGEEEETEGAKVATPQVAFTTPPPLVGTSRSVL